MAKKSEEKPGSDGDKNVDSYPQENSEGEIKAEVVEAKPEIEGVEELRRQIEEERKGREVERENRPAL